ESAFDAALAALVEVVTLGHEKRNIRWQAVILPGLNDVVHVIRLPVQRTPVRALPPAHAGVMLEREELEIGQVSAGFEVIDESAQKRDSPVGARPGVDVAGCPLKSR